MFRGASITATRLEAPGCDSVTPEVEFKLETIRPNSYTWDFSKSDICVKWAVSQELRIRGNCLLWHLHIPDWIAVLPPPKLELQLKNYIQVVVGGYPEVAVWDVANEFVADAGCFRDSPWLQIEDVLEKAFLWAHEANPNALLFYNDYRPMARDKWRSIFAHIHQMKSKGVPIHGIGIQLHHHLRKYLAEGILGWQDLKWVVEEARSRNLEVEFTEVSVLDDLGMPWLQRQVVRQLSAIAQELDVLGFTTWNWENP